MARKITIGIALVRDQLDDMGRLSLLDDRKRSRNQLIEEAISQYVARERKRVRAETGRELGEFPAPIREARDSHTP